MPRRSHPSRPAGGRRSSQHRNDDSDGGDDGAAGWISGWQQTVSTADGDFLVRPVPGAAARKPYRCPGCQQVIKPGVGHLVVWPTWARDDDGGVADRRHWHMACWHRRATRGGPGRIA